VERRSRALDRKAARRQAEAEAEARDMAAAGGAKRAGAKRPDRQAGAEEEEGEDGLETNIQEPELVVLPSGQQVEAERLAPPDLALVQRRIRDCVRVLEDFGRLRQEGRSRADYLEQVGGGGGGGARGTQAGQLLLCRLRVTC
jgi:ribosomal RNA methyltransferase Nop2